MLSIAVLTIVP